MRQRARDDQRADVIVRAQDDSDGDERRRASRFVADVPVSVQVIDQPVPGGARRRRVTRKGRSGDLGELGVCVHTRHAVEVGSTVEIEVEVIMPTRVRLGYDVDALVIDGPSVSHFARIPGRVRRCVDLGTGRFAVGVEFDEHASGEELHVIDLYLDHLRDRRHA